MFQSAVIIVKIIKRILVLSNVNMK